MPWRGHGGVSVLNGAPSRVMHPIDACPFRRHGGVSVLTGAPSRVMHPIEACPGAWERAWWGLST